ncbi:hypothetical protein [Costertonia aggregata]|uniref:Uncharacterized protein n=1 Tax=Costertonia aggregata TaxID=343403 RepID=A0A7H9ATN0_9FLAO|nr:hypothetical protein [Costertonia aggregata]QLG46702.1 hypothetical protein HYG79_15540 [Costertonia aggregata]
MLVLDTIDFKDGGKRIDYKYSTSANCKKFFDKKNPFYIKYEENVSGVPESIAVIPFLCNVLPISWFGDFEIRVGEIDKGFANSVESVKKQFAEQYPNYNLGGKLSFRKEIENSINKKNNVTNTAMLFSGGVDAYATYIRYFDQSPDLITILGADMSIEDKTQWNDFTGFIENEKLLEQNQKIYIESNVRAFYTYQVELLLKDIGWWGKVQHGLSLIGSVAPVSYLKGYDTLCIASSYTEQVAVAWGSTPDIDEKISWAGLQVKHDGYELKRQDKVDLIANFRKEKGTAFRLRVCYSERNTDFNCSNCEKCYRTILGLVLAGENPNNYGFAVDGTFYDEMYKVLDRGGASVGMQYFWWELMQKAKNAEEPFTFKDTTLELQRLREIANGKIDTILQEKIDNPQTEKKNMKFLLRNKFSGMYKLYKRLKR